MQVELPRVLLYSEFFWKLLNLCWYLEKNLDGFCVCVLSHFSLSCLADYAGAQCQFPNPCSPSPCRNGGACRPRTQGNDVEFTCDCALGFSGPLCLTPVNHACMSSPCRNGGSCALLTLSTFSCRCPPGWSGTHPDTCLLIRCSVQTYCVFVHACRTLVLYRIFVCDVQVRHANRRTLVRQTPVPTVASAQHSTLTLSARARPASTGPHVAWM